LFRLVVRFIVHSLLRLTSSVLTLVASRTSPYARKTRIVLAEKKVEYQMLETSAWEPGNPVHAYSPLGKLPVLILDDGTHLYDSRVIAEYVDLVSPVSRLIPEPARQRIAVRKWEALADGVCDAAAAIVVEGRRPAELRSSEWIERQRRKIHEGVAEMSRELGDGAWCHGDGYSLADIACGCALGYLDLRAPDIEWRVAYPNLARLAEKVAKRSSFADTAP
jgi:glutathione S-transferase